MVRLVDLMMYTPADETLSQRSNRCPMPKNPTSYSETTLVGSMHIILLQSMHTTTIRMNTIASTMGILYQSMHTVHSTTRIIYKYTVIICLRVVVHTRTCVWSCPVYELILCILASMYKKYIIHIHMYQLVFVLARLPRVYVYYFFIHTTRTSSTQMVCISHVRARMHTLDITTTLVEYP